MNKYKIVRLLTKLFWVFPIQKNKIFFTSYEGKQFSCNPKYIYLGFVRSDRDLKYVWEYNSGDIPAEITSQKCIVVKHNSIKYLYHLLTSKVIVTNSGITAKIAIRKNQCLINTWHGGGAYKKVGAVIDERINGTGYNLLKIAAEDTTYFLSSSKMFTDVMIPSTLIPREKFLEIGMPRNDIFLNSEKISSIKKKIHLTYNVSENEKIVLFAPTYRGSVGKVENSACLPDVDETLFSLHLRFGDKWVFFYRDHYYKHQEVSEKKSVVDVSYYPDMQELLCAADVLITDYSSSIWDFCLTSKPCFLYVPDLNKYRKERGDFYTDISTWPGIVALNNEMLQSSIMSFENDTYNYKISEHIKKLGGCEDGLATDKTIDLIYKTIG